MIPAGRRFVLALLATLVALAACSSRGMNDPTPAPSRSVVDYAALQSAVEKRLTTGTVALDNVRGVLVSVDGETKIRHYRHGCKPTDTTHVWSVTKSVLSTLVGIAVADGLLRDLDQTLGDLLPRQREVMSPGVAAVTLRQLMTMSAGFPSDADAEGVQAIFASGGDLVQYLLEQGQTSEAGTEFLYSNVSAHLVAAVLAAALERADGDHPRSLLEYAREKLFDPLGIDTRPAFTKPALPEDAEFTGASFGWITDPSGIPLGPFGLRLTTADLLKLGELHLSGGVWQGEQIVPRDWTQQVTRPSALQPEYGLLWWLYSWGGEQLHVARGSEGHLIVVVPSQAAVIAISSANMPKVPMDDYVLHPLLAELIIPTLRG